MWWRLLADVHSEHWVFRGWSQIEEVCSEWLLCGGKCLVDVQGQFWPITSIAVGSLCPESTESLISRLWNTSCVWWHALWRRFSAVLLTVPNHCVTVLLTNGMTGQLTGQAWSPKKICDALSRGNDVKAAWASHSASVVPQCIKYKYLDAFCRHWSWLK